MAFGGQHYSNTLSCMFNEYQKIGKISKQDEMLLNGIIDVEPFDYW